LIELIVLIKLLKLEQQSSQAFALCHLLPNQLINKWRQAIFLINHSTYQLINHFPNHFNLIKNYSLFPPGADQHSFLKSDGHRITNGRVFGNLLIVTLTS
jgi:hypothetical protein